MGFNLLVFSSLTLFLFVLHKLILLQYRTQVILDKLNVTEVYKSVWITSKMSGGINYPCHKHHLKRNNLETYSIR